MSAPISHLPKRINESATRFHFYETRWKTVGLDLLESHMGNLKGGTLLDYGCGRGETLSLARDRGMVAMGADPDEECVAISSNHGNTVLLTSPQDPVLQFGERSFDVVTCFHVLEHVDSPRQVLTSLGRIARKHVVVAVPNLRVLPKPSRFRREPPPVNEGHLQGWDHAHFRNLCERHCGLKVVAWGHDQVRVPLLSQLAARIGGDKFAIKLETGGLLDLFRFHSSSVIALLAPTDENGRHDGKSPEGQTDE